jgi:dCTP diphosphatase
MITTDPRLAALALRLREFAAARDWEPFHSPKNLSMALIAEAAEVLEHFQWLSAEESRGPDAARREAVALELADVFLYLVRLADELDVDLYAAAEAKLAINARRFPPVRR